jgi:hypothetical protein
MWCGARPARPPHCPTTRPPAVSPRLITTSGVAISATPRAWGKLLLPRRYLNRIACFSLLSDMYFVLGDFYWGGRDGASNIIAVPLSQPDHRSPRLARSHVDFEIGRITTTYDHCELGSSICRPSAGSGFFNTIPPVKRVSSAKRLWYPPQGRYATSRFENGLFLAPCRIIWRNLPPKSNFGYTLNTRIA